MSTVDVTIYDGKYRYIFDKDGARALRHGEEWRDCCGDGFILALAQDLDEARAQRDRLREAVELFVRYDNCVDDKDVDMMLNYANAISVARAALAETEREGAK